MSDKPYFIQNIKCYLWGTGHFLNQAMTIISSEESITKVRIHLPREVLKKSIQAS